METIPFSLFVKDTLHAIAILEHQLRIFNYSNTFKRRYAQNRSILKGKHFKTAEQPTTKALEIHLLNCLKGGSLKALGIINIYVQMATPNESNERYNP